VILDRDLRLGDLRSITPKTAHLQIFYLLRGNIGMDKHTMDYAQSEYEITGEGVYFSH